MSGKIKLIIVIILIAGGVWYKLDSKSDTQALNKKPSILVRVTDVMQKDMPVEFETVGTVIPTESVSVKSRLDSQIREVKFRDGDYVKKDDLLFLLDDRSINAQVREQEANLARDKAQLQNLQQQYKRNQELVKSDFASQAELDDSKAAYEAQLATVNATDAGIQNLRVQLEYTKIKAPISGRTGTINVTVGNNVKANDALALVVINQVKPIRVQFSLPQTYIGQVRQAMKSSGIDIYIKQDAGKEPLHGKLEYMDNAVDQQTNTFAVRALFDNPDETLWPGMFVNGMIKLGEEKQVLVIPEEAVQHGQEQDYVFVITNNTAKKTTVNIKRVQGSMAVIDSGLNSGDKVVTDGLITLSDGAAVNIATQDDIKNSDSVEPEKVKAE